MARGKKKEILTPEERLQTALVPESEQPYKVPGNWCWTYLTKGAAECLDSFRKPINASERANREGDIPYYGATGQVGWIDDFLTNEQLVLVGEDGAPFLDLIKDKAYIIEGKAWVNNHAHILRSRFGTVGNSFLMHYLNVFNYNDFVNGTTRLKLTQGSMDTMPVPIPPVPEQQRIVDRIKSLFTKLDEAKQKAQDALDSFEIRKAAILHKAFAGELTAQWRKEHGVGMESWEKLKIGTYAQVKGGKRIPKGHKLVTERTAHPYLRIADFGNGTIDDSDLHYIREDTFSQIKNYIINKEDVYISIVGSIGKAGVIPESLNGANLTENAARIISSRTLPRYLSSFLSSPEAQNDIQDRIRSATLGKLSLLNIKDIETPIPSMEEQIEIVRIIDNLLAKEQQAKNAVEGVLEQIGLIKKAILARAFRGELGTNDPNEESAVELLKNII